MMVIIKKIDDLGRISIPKDIRRSLRWMGGDEIEVIPKDDGTVLLRSHSRVSSERLEILRNEWNDDPDVQEKILELIELIETKEEK